MQNIALLVLGVLITFTSYMNVRGAAREGFGRGVPVLTWSTGINASRLEQRAAFLKWVRDTGRPAVGLELDAVSSGEAKKIIQGVSGVGNTLMDIWGGGLLATYDQMGLLEDVTPYLDDPKGFLADLPPSIAEEITRDGRLVGVPANISLQLIFANLDRLAEAGVAAPLKGWDWDSFTRTGRAYVAAMNQKDPKRRHFFANRLNFEVLKRSMGLSTFNETLSACELDRMGYEKVLAQVYQWTAVDHLLPSRSDMDAMAVEGQDGMSGSWGAEAWLFSTGQLAMVEASRWQVVQFRQLKLTNLAITTVPAHHYPNALVTARYVTLYRGADARHKERAKDFFAFLRSETYSRQIIEDGDALPPDPRTLKSPAFLDPAGHPEERAMNRAWTHTLESVARAPVVSPFISHAVVTRFESGAVDEMLAGRMTPAQAAKALTERVNREIQRNLAASPELAARHGIAVARQKTIDGLKAAGIAVPPDLVANGFLRRYRADTAGKVL